KTKQKEIYTGSSDEGSFERSVRKRSRKQRKGSYIFSHSLLITNIHFINNNKKEGKEKVAMNPLQSITEEENLPLEVITMNHFLEANAAGDTITCCTYEDAEDIATTTISGDEDDDDDEEDCKFYSNVNRDDYLKLLHNYNSEDDDNNYEAEAEFDGLDLCSEIKDGIDDSNVNTDN